MHSYEQKTKYSTLIFEYFCSVVKTKRIFVKEETELKMKFSVIIPLYNKAPYVKKALETVCAQTYREYEIIVINDGSTDNSAIIAGDYLNGVEGISYKILSQPNAGVSAARNNGVAQAMGDYIAFLDADDWWEPSYLERMAQLIEEYPEAGLYASSYYYHKDGQNIIKVDIPTGYFNYPKEYFKNFAMPVWTGATMIPRRVYNEMGGFPVGIKLGEDFLLWAKIALHYPVAFLNEPLAYYNNSLPPNYRATYHLYKPKEHMLFRLEFAFGDEAIRLSGYRAIRRGEYEYKVEGGKWKGIENSGADDHTSSPHRLIDSSPHCLNEDWLRLIDMLRLLGLHSYWLSDDFHEIAQREIDKVDMRHQYDFLVKLYSKPRWVQRFKQRFMYIAAGPMGLLKRLKQKKKTHQTNIIINNQEYRKSLFVNK